MKLLALMILRCPAGAETPVFLCGSYDLSGYAFYQRNTVKEACKFAAKTLAPRTRVGDRQMVDHEGSAAFCLRTSDSLAVVAVGSKDIPPRVAFDCLTRTREEFLRAVPFSAWVDATPAGSSSNSRGIEFKDQLKDILAKYQNPTQSDELTKAMEKAERAHEIVRRTMTEMLRHGESLQELVQKSDDLSEDLTDFLRCVHILSMTRSSPVKRAMTFSSFQMPHEIFSYVHYGMWANIA